MTNRTINSCRACGSSDLKSVLYIGYTELANSFLTKEELLVRRNRYPLDVMLCQKCLLAQLSYVVNPELLYLNYNYITSTSRLINNHLESQSKRALADKGCCRVLEIASNTGVALQKYMDAGCEVLGVDPAVNIVNIASRSGIPTICAFFGRKVASEIGDFDIVIARHVMAHIDDWNEFAQSISTVCKDDSLVIIEVPYLVDMIEGFQFDTIYHEHLSYVSVGPVRNMFRKYGFKVVDVIRHPLIHGGSIEIHLSRTGSEREYGILDMEAKRIGDSESWLRFSNKRFELCGKLVDLVVNAKKDGKSVIGYGASARGNTLINSSGIVTLDYIIDNTPFKIGKYAPQCGIPIVGPEALLDRQPDFAIVTAWTYYDEIFNREIEYTRRGGCFVKPIPNMELSKFK